ncbi:hypothetical protein LSH36_273g01000 [Paralvinella palmiformis]|uniref:Uncharacterized protein n=1 Tax=Paralvinella palmiformis TaxID=53620 RepID=A0AAD9N417_9ANNE|nr:hypothetical protein LSH36_273g01000 [Paralvinella palmiformis]
MDAICINVVNPFSAYTSCVSHLEVMFDSTMTKEQQLNAISRSDFGQLRTIGRIRRYLSTKAATSLVNGLVTSRFVYSTALPHSLSNNLIDKQQRGQNTAQPIITRTSSRSQITPVRKKLNMHALQEVIQDQGTHI